VGDHGLPGYRGWHPQATIRQSGNPSKGSGIHPLPVSVLADFIGVGTTTKLSPILSNPHDPRSAVLVNGSVALLLGVGQLASNQPPIP